jgi:hypothetical protein
VVVADRNLVADLDTAAVNATDADPPDVFVVVNRRNQQLERSVLVPLGRGNVLQNLVKQRAQIGSRDVRVGRAGSRAPRAVKHRAVKLFVVRAEIHQKLQNLVLHLAKTRVGLVDLVDADDNPMVQIKRLLQDETGLRHRAFRRVNQQNNAVHHLQNTLHLAAEIRVTGGIDDVDLHAVVVNGSVLCQNGDSALPFQIAGVHHAGHGFLIVAVDSSLLQKSVHQRGLAVVNVGNNGYISQIFSDHFFLPLSPARKLTYYYTISERQNKSGIFHDVLRRKKPLFVQCLEMCPIDFTLSKTPPRPRHFRRLQ